MEKIKGGRLSGMHLFLPGIFLLLTCCMGCTGNTGPPPGQPAGLSTVSFTSVGAIPPPAGYQRLSAGTASFTAWLRRLPLRQDKTVYLFDGRRKFNQSAQYAVLDLPVGTRDLLQCADVLMRLRAGFLFSRGQYDAIVFHDYAGKAYAWKGGADSVSFSRYLQQVYARCGSASLEKEMKPVRDLRKIQPGDAWIRGGFPGHAVLVADVAVNGNGEKIFLLLQGYQPAQDMHILVNPADRELSPWYRLPRGADLFTPEWTFRSHELRTW